MYSNSTYVKQPFSKFFSSVKTRESMGRLEVWKYCARRSVAKVGGNAKLALSVTRDALGLDESYNFVIRKQNLLSLPWKSKGVVALVISFTVQSVKDAVCS